MRSLIFSKYKYKIQSTYNTAIINKKRRIASGIVNENVGSIEMLAIISSINLFICLRYSMKFVKHLLVRIMLVQFSPKNKIFLRYQQDRIRNVYTRNILRLLRSIFLNVLFSPLRIHKISKKKNPNPPFHIRQ